MSLWCIATTMFHRNFRSFQSFKRCRPYCSHAFRDHIICCNIRFTVIEQLYNTIVHPLKSIPWCHRGLLVILEPHEESSSVFVVCQDSIYVTWSLVFHTYPVVTRSFWYKLLSRRKTLVSFAVNKVWKNCFFIIVAYVVTKTALFSVKVGCKVVILSDKIVFHWNPFLAKVL